MKIGLINLEPKYTNLALEKIRIYHRDKGDEVRDITPFSSSCFDKVYCSSIFDFTPKPFISNNMIVGGSGFDIISELPEDIDNIKPHLNFGYTLRGCPNKCKFCIVWIKEPELKRDGDILDLKE